MTDEQAARTDAVDRAGYAIGVLRTGSQVEGRRWYQDNTREPIRAETHFYPKARCRAVRLKVELAPAKAGVASIITVFG